MSTQWETSLFECHKVKDPGIPCFLNHCCCGVCIWTDALKKANIPNASSYGLGVLFGNILSLCGTSADSSVLRGVGTAQTVTTSASGRIALAKKYQINESTSQTFCASICCPLCAQVQEVNTVMVNEGLRYGSAELLEDVKETHQTCKQSKHPVLPAVTVQQKMRRV